MWNVTGSLCLDRRPGTTSESLGAMTAGVYMKGTWGVVVKHNYSHTWASLA